MHGDAFDSERRVFFKTGLAGYIRNLIFDLVLWDILTEMFNKHEQTGKISTLIIDTCHVHMKGFQSKMEPKEMK